MGRRGQVSACACGGRTSRFSICTRFRAWQVRRHPPRGSSPAQQVANGGFRRSGRFLAMIHPLIPGTPLWNSPGRQLFSGPRTLVRSGPTKGAREAAEAGRGSLCAVLRLSCHFGAAACFCDASRAGPFLRTSTKSGDRMQSLDVFGRWSLVLEFPLLPNMHGYEVRSTRCIRTGARNATVNARNVGHQRFCAPVSEGCRTACP